MAKCDACGQDSDRFLYTCNYCGKHVCSDCRLPENHYCGIKERAEETRQWGRGIAGARGPVPGEEARADCKKEGCSNVSEPGSTFCASCLNRAERESRESVRQSFGESECKSPSCTNVAGHGKKYCLDCRRDRANASGSPDVETTNGSPYNTAGRVKTPSDGGQRFSFGDESNLGRVRGAAKRAIGRVWNALSTILSYILFPLFLVLELLKDIYGFATSRAGFAVIGVGAVLLATGPLGLVSLPSEPVDDTASGVAGWMNDTASETEDSGAINETTVQQLVHDEINARRSNHGLPSLRYAEPLEEVARYHASGMRTNGYFSHTSPEGETLQDRYSKFGIECAGGENIAKTYTEVSVITDEGTVYYDSNEELAVGIVNQWMNSTGHRENILRSSFHAEGIGVVIAGNPDGEGMVVYAVQNFCS